MKRPSAQDCRRATETLIAEHLAGGIAGAAIGGVQKREISNGPKVAVYTVSGPLIRTFDAMLSDLDAGWTMQARDSSIDVELAAPAELVEVKRIGQAEVVKK